MHERNRISKHSVRTHYVVPPGSNSGSGSNSPCSSGVFNRRFSASISQKRLELKSLKGGRRLRSSGPAAPSSSESSSSPSCSLVRALLHEKLEENGGTEDAPRGHGPPLKIKTSTFTMYFTSQRFYAVSGIEDFLKLGVSPLLLFESLPECIQNQTDVSNTQHLLYDF